MGQVYVASCIPSFNMGLLINNCCENAGAESRIKTANISILKCFILCELGIWLRIENMGLLFDRA